MRTTLALASLFGLAVAAVMPFLASRSSTRESIEPADVETLERKAIEAVPSRRVSGEVGIGAFDERATVAPTTESRANELFGIVVDASGAPIPYSLVRLVPRGAAPYDRAIADGASGADGRFAFSTGESQSLDGLEFDVWHHGFDACRVPAVAGFNPIRMARLPALRVRLIVSGSRSKIPWSIWAYATPAGSLVDVSREGQRERDGSYLVENLPVGRISAIGIRAPGYDRPKSEPLDFRAAPNGSYQVEILLERLE